MSFEEHVCYCVNESEEGGGVDGDGAFLPDCVSTNYIGNGVWKCPECGAEDSEHKDDIFKARVRVYSEIYKDKKYLCAEVIPPFNDKLLTHLTDTGGNETSELEKDCLEEFLNDNCFGAIRGHVEGIFDMEVLFYDYATGGDGGEREVVIEICKETPVCNKKSDDER